MVPSVTRWLIGNSGYLINKQEKDEIDAEASNETVVAVRLRKKKLGTIMGVRRRRHML